MKTITEILHDVDDTVDSRNMSLVEAKSYLEQLGEEIAARVEGIREDLRG